MTEKERAMCNTRIADTRPVPRKRNEESRAMKGLRKWVLCIGKRTK